MEIGDIFLYIYVYMVRETQFSSAVLSYIMWEELSVSHFYNIVTIGNGTKNDFQGKRVLPFSCSCRYSYSERKPTLY